eukprot:3359941-Alexandrium_andersonii.AAC.1
MSKAVEPKASGGSLRACRAKLVRSHPAPEPRLSGRASELRRTVRAHRQLRIARAASFQRHPAPELGSAASFGGRPWAC